MSKTKRLVQLNDVSGLVFKCHGCDSALVLPINTQEPGPEDEFTKDAKHVCGLPSDTNDNPVIKAKALIEAFESAIRRLRKGAKECNFVVSFEVVELLDSESKTAVKQ